MLLTIVEDGVVEAGIEFKSMLIALAAYNCDFDFTRVRNLSDCRLHKIIVERLALPALSQEVFANHQQL